MKSKSGRGRPVDWRGTDWSESDQEIAEILGCGVSTVRNKRHDLGLPPKGWINSKRYERIYNVDWKRIDWSKSTRVLAKELGVSRTVVRNKKKEYDN